jgi:hypothetical protein
MKSTQKIHYATGGALVHGDKCCIFPVIAYNSKVFFSLFSREGKPQSREFRMHVFEHM